MKILMGCLILFLASGSLFADDKCKDGDKDCQRPPREVCFNVFCTYDRDHDGKEQGHDEHDGYDKCHAGATFNKFVTDDGVEIDDDSDHDRNPKFEVECDGRPIYNNSGHRYTDWQGTRIQAIQGPYPAIVLGKGALRDTHQYSVSALELWDQTLHGYCYVYTGPQLR
jgi:hypothetical protein